MSKINIEYGLIKTFCPSADGSIYCVQCGQVKRYERKKAEQRKELGLPEILINGE
jgi:hypothetical protein